MLGCVVTQETWCPNLIFKLTITAVVNCFSTTYATAAHFNCLNLMDMLANPWNVKPIVF